jgi:hypothetical protein
VLRVLPRINDDVNEEWLADKGRYQVDGLTKRRLTAVGAGEWQAAACDVDRSVRDDFRRARQDLKGDEHRRRSRAICSMPRRCLRPRRFWSTLAGRPSPKAARPA